MDSDDLHTLSRQGKRPSEGAEEAGGFFVPQQFADEPFAGVADEEGLAEVVETVGARHQGDVVLVRLPEADAGVEADSFAVDAGSEESVAALAEVVVDFGDDVGVGRVVLHRLRRPLHVHRADAGLSFASDGNHLRVAGQPRDVVDDLRSGSDGRAGDGPFGSVDGEDGLGAGAMEGFDDWDNAAPFFFGIHGGGIGAGTLAADVQNGGPFVQEPQAVLSRRFAAEELAPIGKAIRRDVHNPHQ